ncbi:MAG: c-type cytochrome [Desulfuromonadales bacterium]|nr:c-type cytochrome [Desulfuromonadales bacterium]
MNYPVWYLPGIGGGFLIALIAVTHVFVSHFAVGGGLYLVLTERKGLRENRPEILAFTKSHTKFFLLLTMVFGGITGVGIWFIISLVQPAATSLLIHTFVYGWAAEWVWFLVEITALLIYFYTFDKMDSRTHQLIGWIYFIAAWLSLFLINGIIDFMLTPGAWLDNRNFWSGFFNPSFWPSLFFRSFFSFMLAGLYAFLTSAFLKDSRLKTDMTRYSGKWSLISFLLALPCGYWYLSILPEPAHELVLGSSPTIQTAGQYALIATIITFALILLLTIVRPALNSKPLAILAMISAFIMLGSFEWTREAARRPYVLNQIMYSHGITVAQADALQGQSFLAQAKWSAVNEATAENLSRAGGEIFRLQCYACHTIGGVNNDIVPRTAAMDFPTLTTYLRNVIHKRPYMPQFLGNDMEAAALAAYLAGDLHGREVDLAALVTPTDRGQQIYNDNCIGCHDIDIVETWAERLSLAEIITGLESLSSLNEMMSDFTGTPEEKLLLAGYLHSAAAPAVIDGATVYEQNCTGCHGKETLLDWAGNKSKTDITGGLANLASLNAMMAGLSLDEQERAAIADWILTEQRGGR